MTTAPLPPAFRRLAWSNLAAQGSEQVALAAAPLVAVVALGAGASETAWLQAAGTLPFLLCAIPAGILADRAARNRLLAGAEALRLGAALATLVLLGGGWLGIGGLALLTALGAVGTVVYTVAAPALVPALVPRASLADANRAIELARAVAFAAGPALGGAAVGALGAPAAYSVAAALSLAAVLLLAGLPTAAPLQPVVRNVRRDLAEGARFVAGHRLLRPILVTAVAFNLSWFVLMGVFVAYAVERLGLDPAATGLVLAAYGLGTVTGALGAPVLVRRFRFGLNVAIGPVAALVGSLAVAATLLHPSGFLAAFGLFLFGAGPIVWTITTTTLRQAVTPDRMLGRVSALIVMATAGARPLGAGLAALVAARFGVETCLLLSLAGFALQAALVLASPLARLAALPAEGSPDAVAAV